MKLVIAIIRAEALQPVQTALTGLGCSSTYSEVVSEGNGAAGITMIYRGAKIQVAGQKRVRLETVVDDDSLEYAVEAIQRHGDIGQADGVILVLPVAATIRLRSRDYSGDRPTANLAHMPRLAARPLAAMGN
jgi:nitrogen regulatory protein PII